MLRGKPFHHFKGKLLYHFLRGRGVNKIFVLFLNRWCCKAFRAQKKTSQKKSARSLLIFGFALVFISGFASNHSINLAKILYHNRLGEIKTCSAIFVVPAQIKTSFYSVIYSAAFLIIRLFRSNT